MPKSNGLMIPLSQKLEMILKTLKLNTLSELLMLLTRTSANFARRNGRKGLAFRDEAEAEAWYLVCMVDEEKLAAHPEPMAQLRKHIGFGLLKYFMRWKQNTVYEAQQAGTFVPQVFPENALKY